MVQLVQPRIGKVTPRPRENIKAVVIFSGGVDSTTLLYDVLNQGYKVYPITFHYGQRHLKEVGYAHKTCIKLGIPYRLVELEALEDLAPSALTREDIEIPKVGYDEESMKDTVVPNRNMVFISLATAYAIGLGADYVFMGAHGGDHALYPDCTPNFMQAMERAVMLADWGAVSLKTPYIYWYKKDIIKLGLKLEVDYSLTWSCYEGKDIACGQCGTCVERREAFRLAGVEDPIDYGS